MKKVYIGVAYMLMLCSSGFETQNSLNIKRMMIVEQMLKNAQTPLLHIADVSGSALFNADCMDILPLIPDESVDVILTDPPYNIGYADWDKFFHIPEITKEWYRILKPNGSVFLFCRMEFCM